MGSCAYVSEDVRIKQEIIELVTRLEEMGLEEAFCKMVFDDDILNFFKDKK